jgi:hypothetical protein
VGAVRRLRVNKVRRLLVDGIRRLRASGGVFWLRHVPGRGGAAGRCIEESFKRRASAGNRVLKWGVP